MKTVAGESLGRDRADFFKKYEEYMNPGALTGGRTREGQERQYKAEMAARRTEENLRRAGKDPHEVYDPDSPNFFGRPGNIQKYAEPTLAQKLRAQAAKYAPPGPPSQPLRDQGLQMLKDRFKTSTGADNAPAATADMPTVRNKKEFDALNPGTRYVGDDGRVYRKPEKAQQ